MKLIVGLGNPGKEYKNTRHNVGFMFIDFFLKDSNSIFKEKFNGLYTESIINDEKVIVLKPLTYMNLSGECVKKYVDYFKVSLNDVLIIYDDINFEIGKYKIKKSGSSGGHNGINNIIKNLKTEDIKRIKIGISKNDYNLKNYVLGNFKSEDINILNNTFVNISNVVNEFCNCMDFEKILSKYNVNEKRTI